MISIQLNTDEFEYDIRSLVKAFYPKEAQYVHCEESRVIQQKAPDEEPDAVLFVTLLPEEMTAYFEGEEDREIRLLTVPDERGQRKNDVKKLLYRLLSQRTGNTLPWGTLTGIRPTKLFTKALEAGEAEEAVCARMREDYGISEEKLHTGLRIAKKERQLLSTLPEKRGYSLYLHVPFCPTTCLYCSFTSFPEAAYRQFMDDYVEALRKELRMYAELLSEMELTTIYVGGGTPTTLSAAQLSCVLKELHEQFDLTHLREFTVEAGRPDSITQEKLRVLYEQGVDRISINPQTMNDATLRILGRRHSVEQTREAFRLARACGFENINMDIILGLPEEGEEEVIHTLQEIEKLGPDSLTAHSLSLKHNSRLNLQKEQYTALTFGDAVSGMLLAEESAKRMGMEPYYLYRQKQIAGNQENVGYAKEGKEGLYNILIMEERQSIFSVGAGAVTKIVKEPGELFERVETVKDVKTYLSRLDEMIERKKEALQRAGF